MKGSGHVTTVHSPHRVIDCSLTLYFYIFPMYKPRRSEHYVHKSKYPPIARIVI